jgi:hypothetical protein
MCVVLPEVLIPTDVSRSVAEGKGVSQWRERWVAAIRAMTATTDEAASYLV